MVVSWSFSKPKTDRDPHGNLTKVDKEEVATYYHVTKQKHLR